MYALGNNAGGTVRAEVARRRRTRKHFSPNAQAIAHASPRAGLGETDWGAVVGQAIQGATAITAAALNRGGGGTQQQVQQQQALAQQSSAIPLWGYAAIAAGGAGLLLAVTR